MPQRKRSPERHTFGVDIRARLDAAMWKRITDYQEKHPHMNDTTLLRAALDAYLNIKEREDAERLAALAVVRHSNPSNQ